MTIAEMIRTGAPFVSGGRFVFEAYSSFRYNRRYNFVGSVSFGEPSRRDSSFPRRTRVPLPGEDPLCLRSIFLPLPLTFERACRLIIDERLYRVCLYRSKTGRSFAKYSTQHCVVPNARGRDRALGPSRRTPRSSANVENFCDARIKEQLPATKASRRRSRPSSGDWMLESRTGSGWLARILMQLG